MTPGFSYDIVESEIHAENYAFGNWKAETGNLVHFFSPAGPLFKDLSKNGAVPFIPQLAKAIRNYYKLS